MPAPGPEEVAIVGSDVLNRPDRVAAAATTPLSSVRQPRHELGRRAAELLLEEITDPGAHRHQRVTFAPDLVARASTVGWS